MDDDRLERQGERLLTLGVHALAGLSAEEFRELVRQVPESGRTPVLVVGPALVPPSRLAGLLRLGDRPGFVVEDMVDLDQFVPIEEVTVPQAPIYAIDDVDRGDDMLGWSPSEALPEILGRGRRPLTVSEGISWLLQEPARLEANRCFMTIASRKRTARGGLDARTPAVWISGGTGRDGRERRGAPKVGWCWWNNRHTWLGFASTSIVVPAGEPLPASDIGARAR